MHENEIVSYIFGVKTEKSNATAIPRFRDEHLEFIKERLLHRNPYWQIVDQLMIMYPDFEPEGVDIDYYMDRLYQRIVEHATNPALQMSKEIKSELAAQDKRIAKLAHTDKYLQLAALCNYIERDWRPRTFVRTATDSFGNEHDIYKSNIGELIKCFSAINKLTDDLGIVQSSHGKHPATGPAKPVDPLIAQAMAEGNPGPGDSPRSTGVTPPEAFPSFAGPPPKEEEDVSPALSKRKPIIKV